MKNLLLLASLLLFTSLVNGQIDVKNGKIGIGMTDAQHDVQVRASEVLFEDKAGVNIQMYIGPDGKVGIGTAAPAFKMDIAGTVSRLRGENASMIVQDHTASWASAEAWYYAGEDAASSSSDLDQAFRFGYNKGKFSLQRGTALDGSSYNEVFTVTGTGNVGIGTSIPITKQHVKIHSGTSVVVDPLAAQGILLERDNSTALNIITPNNKSGNLYFGDPENSDQGRIMYNHTNDYMSISTAASERVRIDDQGNVGIGTTSPSEKLHVAGKTKTTSLQVTTGAGVDKVLQSDAAGNATWVDPNTLAGANDNLGNHTASENINLNGKWISGDGGNEGVFINTLGSVGIGSAAIESKLDVQTANAVEVGIHTEGLIADASGVGNYVPTSSWNIGSGSVGIFRQNGTTAENLREHSITPYGEPGILWKASPDVVSGADGGWVSTVFSIDHEKTYRSLVWVKRTGTNTTNGRTYLGCAGNVTYLNGNDNNNPYFYNNFLPELDKWYLIVGYVHSSASDITQSLGGVYDAQTGEKIQNTTDYKLKTSSTVQTHRTYLYYSTETENNQYFWGPRFEEVNGSEPSLAAILGRADAKIWTKTGTDATYENGNVGIGTTAPAELLHLESALPSIRLQDNTNNYYHRVVGNDDSLIFQADEDNSSGSGDMRFDIGGTEKMRIESNGYIGMGVTDPSTNFHVRVGAATISNPVAAQGILLERDNAAAFTIITPNDKSGRIYFGDPQDSNEGGILYNHVNDRMSFRTLNSDRMTIGNAGVITLSNYGLENISTGTTFGMALGVDQNGKLFDNTNVYYKGGNVGIGTITPTRKLHLSENGFLAFRLENTGVNGSAFEIAAYDDGIVRLVQKENNRLILRTNNIDRFTIDGDGNVGIGTTSPSEKLDVAGKTKTTSLQVTTGAGADKVLQSDAAGNATWVDPSSLQGQPGWYTKDIVVGGDAHSYYPLVIQLSEAAKEVQKINIHRAYFEEAPSTWNTASHKGSLKFEARIVGGTWGGNPNSVEVVRNEYVYSTQVAKAELAAHGYSAVIWLRGGGAIYHLTGTTPNIDQAEVHLTTTKIYDHSNDAYDSEVSLTTEVTLQSVNPRTIAIRNNNVGVGTSSPSEKLDINGGVKIRSTNKLSFTNTSNQTYIHAPGSNHLAFATNSQERIRINADGNVGIGTNTPAVKLEVSGAQSAYPFLAGQILAGSSDAAAINKGGMISFGGSYTGTTKTTFASIGGKKETATAGNYAGYLQFNTRAQGATGAERMRITSGGNVGIGTTIPSQKLHVYGGSIDTRKAQDVAGTEQLYFGIHNGNAAGTANNIGTGITFKPQYGGYTKRSAGIQQVGQGNYFRSGLAFFTNGTANATTDWSERMRIDMNGNVGIGTTTPGNPFVVKKTLSSNIAGAALDFASSSGEGNGLFVRGGGVNAGRYILQLRDAANNTRSSFLANGNVGIGTTSPSEKLDVAGKTKTTSLQVTTGAGAGKVLQSDAAGNATWVDPNTLAGANDNLGNHTASENINLNGKWISGDGGNEGIAVNSNGNVGIGLSNNIRAKFHLSGEDSQFGNIAALTSGTNYQGIYISAGNEIGYGEVIFKPITIPGSGTAQQYTHFADADYGGAGRTKHNVLIDGILDVQSKTKTTSLQVTTGAGAGKVLQSDASGNANWVDPNTLAGANDNLGNHTASENINLNGKWISGDGGNEGIRIDATGKVGIGTTAPDEKLHVKNGDILIEGTSNPTLAFGHSGPTRWVEIFRESVSGKMVFQANQGLPFSFRSQGVEKFSIENSALKAGAYGLENISSGTTFGMALGTDQNGKLFDNTNVYYKGGNVGIGTSEPLDELHIKNSGSIVLNLEADSDNATETDQPKIQFSQDGGGVKGHIGFTGGTNHLRIGNEYVNADADIDFQTSGATRMTIDGNGNVGMGTDAPESKLHVNGDIMVGMQNATGGTLRLWGTTPTKHSSIFTSNGNLHIDAGWGDSSGDDDIYLNYYNGGGIHFGNGSGGEHSNVDKAGNWNLGGNLKLSDYTGTNHNATPTSILGVDASGNVVKSSSSNYLPDGYIGNTGTHVAGGNLNLGGNTIGNVSYLTTDYLRVEPQNTGNAGGEIRLVGAGSFSDWILDSRDHSFRLHNSGNTHFQLGNTGQLMVSNSTIIGSTYNLPQERLDVYGSIRYSGSIYRASDKRLKSNISDFNYGLNEVLRLNPINFSYTKKVSDNTDQKHVGLIAQELQKVTPELVSDFKVKSSKEEKAEEFLRIDESAIKYMLINAIKDQQKLIDALTLKLENQEPISPKDSEPKDAIIESLIKRIELLETRQDDLLTQINISLSNSIEIEQPYLSQNIPNPTSNSAIVKYYVPETATDATVKFFSLSGQLMKEVELDQLGQGEIKLDLEKMMTGSYMYALIVDGELIDTKTMVIVK